MAAGNVATQEIQSVYGRIHLSIWEALTNDLEGDAISIPTSPDQSVQFEGTFGGATVVLQGSNDGTNYHTLHTPAGALVSATAAGLFQVSEVVRKIRPTTVGGDGTTAIVASVLSRGES